MANGDMHLLGMFSGLKWNSDGMCCYLKHSAFAVPAPKKGLSIFQCINHQDGGLLKNFSLDYVDS